MKTKKRASFVLASTVWIVSALLADFYPYTVFAANMPLPNVTSAADAQNPSTQSGVIGYGNSLPAGQKTSDPSAAKGENASGSEAAAVNRKKTTPTASILFSSDGVIKQGVSVSARALTSGFSEPTEKMYFTWYLKHAGCDLKDNPSQAEIDRCDMDGDNKITVNDWKIEASRIIVDGKFTNGNYSQGVSDQVTKDSGVEASPSVTDDKTGWVINFKKSGGSFVTENSDSRDVKNCYVQEPSSGAIYELRGGGQGEFDACPNGWHRACVDYEEKTCSIPNPCYNPPKAPSASTYDIDGTPGLSPSEQAAFDAAQQQYVTDLKNYDTPAAVKWGVKVCDAYDGAVNTLCSGDDATKYLSLGTNDKNKQQCDVTKGEKLIVNTRGPDSMHCDAKSETDLANYSGQTTCDRGLPVCIKDGLYTEVRPTSGGDPLYGTVWNDVCSQAGAKELLNNNQNGKQCIEGNNNGTIESDENGIWNKGFKRTNYNKTNTNAEYIDEECKILVSDLINGVRNEFGGVELYPNPSMLPTCTLGQGGHNMCKHLFPYFPKNSTDVPGVGSVDLSGEKTGDGSFTINEKKFWKADPTKASTAGEFKDEAAVMGQGVDHFSWLYATGDQIGVAVEGDAALPSQHADSSMMRMWAFSKNVCPAIKSLKGDDSAGVKNEDNINKGNSNGTINEGTRSYYTETTNGNTVGILTANFDVNDCLKDNLVDPLVESGTTMSVNLTATPEQPINDPNGQGDALTISASVDNSPNAPSQYFDWKVDISPEGSLAPTNSTQWVDITDFMKMRGILSDASLKGLNRGSLKIMMNIDFNKKSSDGASYNIPSSIPSSSVFYMRIRTTVSEKEGAGSQDSSGTITLKVLQQKNEIVIQPVTANAGGMLSATFGSASNLRCSDASGRNNCLVTSNEILGLEVPNGDGALQDISWKVNGVDMICKDGSASGGGQCAVGGRLFLPILGDVGETIKVQADAVDSATNEHVTVARNFQIIAPTVMITSANPDMVWPKLKGYFKGLDGSTTPDYSTTNFETLSGGSISLNAVFYPAANKDKADFNWLLDGEVQGTAKNNETFSFAATKGVGDSYNVGIDVEYKPAADSQLNNLRTALLKLWNVSPLDSTEQNEQKNIQINVVDGVATMAMGNSSMPWAANLLSHIPEQVLFSLRILLTALLLLFVTRVVFSFMPEFEEKRT